MKKPLITLILLLIIIIGLFLYYKEGTLLVNSKDKTAKIFVVNRGEGVNSIVKRLDNERLIRNRIIFYILIKKMGIAGNIQAGDFRLSPSMTATQIAKALTKGTLDVWVTIVEGLRKEEIANLVSRDFSIPESEFLEYALEGYLFPDTYLIPREATAGAIINILTNNFNRRYSDELKQIANRKNLSDYEVLILASLVEKEAKHDTDRVKVASIILKRWRRGWPLQVDATVQYAIGYQPNEKTWWKKNLTADDLVIDSPYNTYKHRSLPPTPIGNPGLASITAVLKADENTPYWFYISSRDGSKMYYAKTAEEHAENIRKHLR